MNTRVPAAVRAIAAAVTAHIPTAQVIVGPGATEDPGDVVMVGVSDPDETVYAGAVSGSQHWAQLGGLFRDEQFVVHCIAIASNGDGDALAAMDAAYTLMGAVETALVADPTFGGTLLYSMGLTSAGLKFSTDQTGVAALVPFDVECRTRI